MLLTVSPIAKKRMLQPAFSCRYCGWLNVHVTITAIGQLIAGHILMKNNHCLEKTNVMIKVPMFFLHTLFAAKNLTGLVTVWTFSANASPRTENSAKGKYIMTCVRCSVQGRRKVPKSGETCDMACARLYWGSGGSAPKFAKWRSWRNARPPLPISGVEELFCKSNRFQF